MSDDATSTWVILAICVVLMIIAVVTIFATQKRKGEHADYVIRRILVLLGSVKKSPADTSSRDELLSLLYYEQTAAYRTLPKVLDWLAGMIHNNDPGQLATVTAVVSRNYFTSAQTTWLYQRSLESVQASKGDPAIKTLALQIGRLSYASSRPDRRPTIYDEQAIANDIAVRS
jgi:hypothetical protein